MPVINVLDKAVAELIAAGEVVERPASIVKELLENSIDAGASDITVEISGGGIALLRVSDNGCGISKNDVPKAFLRHATSKISNAGDLDGILTLGFRGEALASIAAMCRVELVTKAADEDEGTAYVIEGGEVLSSAPAGRPKGATITVRDVFFNTPARMKFLKKDVSEGNSVAAVVDKCALSHPEIAFKFIRDGAVKLKTSGGGELLSVIYEIHGRDFASEMLEVDYVYENFARVSGYISKPSASKPSRAYQNFFINNRFIRTKTAMAAVEEAFKGKLMTGRFPACFLNLELDAAGVDVNVHPAKLEVRFENEKPVFSAVYYAVKTALAGLEAPLSGGGKPFAAVPEPEPQRLSAEEYRRLYAQDMPEQSARSPYLDAGDRAPVTLSMNARRVEAPQIPLIYIEADAGESVSSRALADEKFSFKTDYNKKVPNDDGKIFDEAAINRVKNATIINVTPDNAAYRVIGEAFGTYILIEDGDGLILVDKHAAHERILYEKLKAGTAYESRQVLLVPQSVALSREEHAALIENAGQAEKLGFLVEDFGGGDVIVREAPVELGEQDVACVIRELADNIIACKSDLTPSALERLYYSIACRSAVKAGDKNNIPELLEIIRQLNENPSITHCPHGRPVFIRLSRHELEKKFGRLG